MNVKNISGKEPFRGEALTAKEIAERYGMKEEYVKRLGYPKGALHACRDDETYKFYTDNQTFKTWVRSPHRVKSKNNKTKIKNKETTKSVETPPTQVMNDVFISPDASAEGLSKYGEYTLNQIVELFGTVAQFGKVLKAYKELQDAREKKLKNDEKMGRLISRDFVMQNLFGPLDSALRRFLSEMPIAIAQRVQGGETLQEKIQLITSIVEQTIKPFIQGMTIVKNTKETAGHDDE